MLGYHPVVMLPFHSQRQQPSNRDSSHTGLPNAAAMWATELSIVITRSSWSITLPDRLAELQLGFLELRCLRQSHASIERMIHH
jgi:hypothetical protein